MIRHNILTSLSLKIRAMYEYLTESALLILLKLI
jgi:hypothetical protein